MNNSIYVKKVHWDSTKDPIEYPEKIKDIFFKLFIKNRKKFTKWVSKTVSKNFDDLIKLPFTRDPYKSDLFKNLLILKILKNEKIVNEIDTVILDKSPPKQIYLKLKKKNNLKIFIKNKKSSIFNILKIFITSIIIFFFIKSLKIKKNVGKKNIILFNTYLSLEGKIKDFVFPELYKILQKKKINNFYFIPDIVFTKKIFSFYKNLKKISRQNYLFKENYISFIEFLNCFISTIFYKKKKITLLITMMVLIVH